jgi:hypothetical protein
MRRRLRWGNVFRAACVVALVAVVVAWPRLAPPEPGPPRSEAAPLERAWPDSALRRPATEPNPARRGDEDRGRAYEAALRPRGGTREPGPAPARREGGRGRRGDASAGGGHGRRRAPGGGGDRGGTPAGGDDDGGPAGGDDGGEKPAGDDGGGGGPAGGDDGGAPPGGEGGGGAPPGGEGGGGGPVGDDGGGGGPAGGGDRKTRAGGGDDPGSREPPPDPAAIEFGFETG